MSTASSTTISTGVPADVGVTRPTVSHAAFVIVVVASILLMLASPADAGTSDELAQPPAASCDSPLFESPYTYSDDGFASNPIRFGSSGSLLRSLSLPDTSFGPGNVQIDEIVTFDGHVERAAQVQPNEQVRIEFRLDGEIVATTGSTDDLADGTTSAWNAMSLGSVELALGATEVVIVHHGANGNPAADSLGVTSICASFTPQQAPETSTPPPTTIAPPATTTPPPATTTAPPPSTSLAPQEPAPTTTLAGPPELAITGPGDSTTGLALVGLAMVGLGATLFLTTRSEGE